MNLQSVYPEKSSNMIDLWIFIQTKFFFKLCKIRLEKIYFLRLKYNMLKPIKKLQNNNKDLRLQVYNTNSF